MSKNKNKFWKLWGSANKQHCSQETSSMNGNSDHNFIAKSFAENFQKACSPNNPTFYKTETEKLEKMIYNLNDESKPRFTVENVEDAIKKIQKKTTPGLDSIVLDHIKCAHPSVILFLY